MTGRLDLAINTFVWHSPITDRELPQRLETLAGWGFEGVELPLENIDDFDPESTAALLDRHGLRCVVCAVFGAGRELTAAEPETIAATQEYLRRCVDVARVIGAGAVVGPMYTSVGRTWRMSMQDRRSAFVTLRESLRPIADYAGEHGVRLGVEPLNRYETSLMNTVEQAMEAIDGLPAGVVGLNLDTYHQNIEEKSIAGAIELAGDRIVHVQVCGNDRGAPGEDHLDWAEIRTALSHAGYTGMLGIESFTADNATISTAASIWRPLAPTQDDLARSGLRFLREWRAGWPCSG